MKIFLYTFPSLLLTLYVLYILNIVLAIIYWQKNSAHKYNVIHFFNNIRILKADNCLLIKNMLISIEGTAAEQTHPNVRITEPYVQC